MHSRKMRARSRRNSGSPEALRTTLIVVGACLPVVVVGYAVRTAHSGPAVNAANVSHHGQAAEYGWGRGGYMMMPGPAGDGSGTGASDGGGSGSGGQAGIPGSGTGTPANAVAMSSANWAGYAAQGNQGTFTSVAASWTQPAVSCGAADTFSSFWVGLDGDGTPSVEQTGTEADCANGAAVYQGWFEMFPAAPVFYNNPVQPGDSMNASVVANGGGSFTLTLTDATQNWTQATNQVSDQAQLGSAEVIAEAPSAQNVLPLSNFGTVGFTGAAANGNPIGNDDPSPLTMVSQGGVTEATPSALTGGNAFTVTWNSSGTAAAGAASGQAATASPSSPAAADGSTGAATTSADPGATGNAPAATDSAPGRHHHHLGS